MLVWSEISYIDYYFLPRFTVSCMKLVIVLLYNHIFIYQVLCTLIYRRRSLYSFLRVRCEKLVVKYQVWLKIIERKHQLINTLTAGHLKLHRIFYLEFDHEYILNGIWNLELIPICLANCVDPYRCHFIHDIYLLTTHVTKL